MVGSDTDPTKRDGADETVEETSIDANASQDDTIIRRSDRPSSAELVDPCTSVYEPTVGDLVDGRYELRSFLGRGGFAIVYLAVDTDTGRNVAVKFPRYKRLNGINPDNKITEHFDREIEFLQSIRAAGGHPSIVRLAATGVHDHLTYSVVEFVDGESLEDMIVRQPLSAEAARAVGIDLCDALSFIHENEIVYRDLKPDNVMQTVEGSLKIIDLNAAARFNRGPDLGDGSTVFSSSPFYPIEMGQSSLTTDPLPLGAHTDVYAVGKFLFFLLAGSVPAEDDVSVSAFGIDAPPYLEAIIEQSTRRHPVDRYHNTTVIKRALERRDASRPEQARIQFIQGHTEGTTATLSPGDTVGRAGVEPSPSVPVPDTQSFLSAVHARFDVDDEGTWFIHDLSTNGTYVDRHDGTGWTHLLSGRGHRKRANQNKATDSSRDTLILAPTDTVALVHPTYGIAFEFLGDTQQKHT